MKRLTLGIVCLLLIPAWSSGAAQTGTIKGSVVDSSGRPIVGAVVQMATVAPATIDRMVLSDDRGGFAFESLVSGEYLVHVTKPLFAASQKEKIVLETGTNSAASLRFHLQTVEEVGRRAASRDAKRSDDILWVLRASRGTQSVLKYSDSPSLPVFRRLLPDYSGYIQFYSKADPGARTASNTMGSRFSVTLGGFPSDAKVTFSGQYNESPLEPKGVSALYEFTPAEGHESKIGLNVRQGVVLDDAFSTSTAAGSTAAGSTAAGSTAALEELKEFQLKYSDKFNLTETIIVRSTSSTRTGGSPGWGTRSGSLSISTIPTTAACSRSKSPRRTASSF
jgi:hypothetical protein